MSIDQKSDVGDIVEVDLEYPNELHKLHSDYPLAPEKLTALMIYFENIVKKLLINMK